MGNHGSTQLPTVLVATDGREPQRIPTGLTAGTLLRDTNLAAVVQFAASGDSLLAIDIDSVEGLDGDDTAAEFVTGRLGISIVLTRRAPLAARIAELGYLGMLHVFAFDSTGLSRSLESHPRTRGVGTVVSPGLVLPHFRTDEIAQLPRPILAYGLIASAGDAIACLEHADGVVLRSETAAAMARISRSAEKRQIDRPGRQERSGAP